MRAKLLEFIDGKARLRYSPFVAYLKTISADDFSRYARHPFLMGKDLFEGQLESNTYNNTDSNTMAFQKADVRAMLNPNQIKSEGMDTPEPKSDDDNHSAITKALFMLVKRKGSPGLSNEIYVGRNHINDIVIADYAVSKQHVKIIVNKGRYSIVDVGSTNGTFYNDYPLKQGVEYELPPDNDIAFGRLVFRFISPRQLYNLLT